MKVIIAGVCLLVASICYSQNVQNPDGVLVFSLKDKNQLIEFNAVNYNQNKEFVYYDKSKRYTIKIISFNKNDSKSISNFQIKNDEGISYFKLGIGWSNKIIVEFTKNKIKTMVVVFENIYGLSAKTEIIFKKGNYKFDVKQAIEKNDGNIYIGKKYLKKFNR